MTVVGEAFVTILPLSAGFAAELEAQLQAAGLAGKAEASLGAAGVAGGKAITAEVDKAGALSASNLEKQFSNAGVASGNSFAGKVKNALAIAGLDSGPAFAAAFTVAAVAGLAAIGNQFANLNKQIENETGATGAALTSLAASATAAFRQVPVSLSTAGDAVDELRRRGVPLGDTLTQLATQELFLAKVSKTDLGSAVADTTAVLARFNVPLGDQSRQLDVLFKGYQQSGQSLGDLTSALQTGGLTLQAFGFNLDQSTSLLANLEKHGASLQPILAGLRLAFGKITTEGGDPAKVLANLVKEFTDGTPRAQALSDAVNLFGKRSGAELAQQMAAGNFSVKTLLDTITNGKDGIVATGLATLTLGDQFKLLSNNIETDLSGAGTVALQTLETTLKSLSAPVEDLIGNIGHLGIALAPVVVGLGGGFSVAAQTAGPALEVLSLSVGTTARGLRDLENPLGLTALGLGAVALAATGALDALQAAAVGAREFTLAFAANPVVVAVAAIAAVGVVLDEFSHKVDPATAEAKSLSSALFDTASSTGVFKDGIESATQGVKDFLASAPPSATGNIAALLQVAGSSTDALATALGSGTAAWERYKGATIAAADATSANVKVGKDVAPIQSAIGPALDQQSRALLTTARSALTFAAASHGITGAQKDQITSQFALNSSNADAAGALDRLNGLLDKHLAKVAAVAQALPSTQQQEAALAKGLADGSISTDQATKSLTDLLGGADAAKVELKLLQSQAEDLNQAQDQLAARTAPTTAAYAKLADQLASGTITADDAATAFHGIGFSIAGAPAAVSALQSAVDSFVSSAVSKLPSVVSAINDVNTAITGDQSTLASDLKQRTDLASQLADTAVSTSTKSQQQLATVNLRISNDQQNLDVNNAKSTQKLATDQLKRNQIIQNAASAQGGASKSLLDSISKNNAAILADQKKLADDQSPDAFIKKLLGNAETIVNFTKNLNKLFTEGFQGLAGDLATQGPKVAGGLAEALASDPAKARVANAAADLNQTASTAFQTFLKNNAGPLTGLGAQQGGAIGKAISDGLTAELLKNFPFLKSLGVGVGTSVTEGATDAVTKGAPVVASAAAGALHLSLGAINLRDSGAAVGDAFANTAAGAIHRTLATANFATDGTNLSESLAEGFLAGIVDKTPEVLLGVDTFGGQIVEHMNKQFRAQSPSKVMFDLGQNVAQGLALGITDGTATVTAAGTTIAARFVSNVSAGLNNVGIGRSVGADLASGITASSGDVITAASRLVSQLATSTSSVTIPAPRVAPLIVPTLPTLTFPPAVVPGPVLPSIVFPVPLVPRPTVPSPAAPQIVIAAPIVGRPTIPAPEVPSIVIPTPTVGRPIIPSISRPTIPTPVVPTPFVPTIVVPAPVVGRPVVPTPFVPTITIGAPTILRPQIPTPVVPVVSIPTITIPTPTVGRPVVPDPLVPAAVTISAPLVGRPVVPTPAVPVVSLPVHVATPVVPVPVLDARTSSIGPQISSSILASVTLAGTSVAASIAALSGQLTNSFGTKPFEDIGEKIGTSVTTGIKNTTGLSKQVTAQLIAEIMATLEAGLESPKEKANLLKLLTQLGAPATQFSPPSLASPIAVAQAKQSLTVPAPQDRADAQRQLTAARGLFDGATVNFPKDMDPLHVASELTWIAEHE